MASYEGLLYRVLDVVWQHEPLSGRGAELHGGRLNPQGLPALYTSTSIEAALREATQGAGRIQPRTIVCYEAHFTNLLDLSTEDLAKAFGTSMRVVGSPTWRGEMKEFGQSASQALGHLVSRTYDGVIVPSFAPDATADLRNLVLYRWSDDLPTQLRLVDDRNQLTI